MCVFLLRVVLSEMSINGSTRLAKEKKSLQTALVIRIHFVL